ncbi:ATP-dependent Clp protease proteolytic subunit, partial [Arthrospira platensis SPKY1]|nr:ATP-dependent Clp protease proteolytic subunit [Arthrospira platensis SPKY1]
SKMVSLMVNNRKEISMQYKTKQTKDEDDLDFPFLQGDRHISFMLKEQTHTQRLISFVLDQEIKEPSYYRPLLENIYQANEGDAVIMRIDSYGGSVDGALAIIDAIENTDADVHCYVSGMAASAATIIALSCPSISVSKRARFMIHNASFGSL